MPAYARYPEKECGTLDIRDGTYIVEMSKHLIKDVVFREMFKCVEEFIERNAETKRCRDILMQQNGYYPQYRNLFNVYVDTG